ncbi:FxLYD domain-containing protein [Peptoanaerobacter stomatis]
MNKANKILITISAILVIISLVGVVVFLSSNYSSNTSKENLSGKYGDVSEKPVPDKTVDNQDSDDENSIDVEISNLKVFGVNKPYINIRGELKNNTNKALKLPTISFDIRDDVHGDLSDRVEDILHTPLKAGDTWNFDISAANSFDGISVDLENPIITINSKKVKNFTLKIADDYDKNTPIIRKDNKKNKHTDKSASTENFSNFENAVENDTTLLINGKDYEIVDISFDTDYSGPEPLYAYSITIKNISGKTIPITHMTYKEHVLSSYNGATSDYERYLYNFRPNEIYNYRTPVPDNITDIPENDILLEAVNRLPDAIYNTGELLSGLSSYHDLRINYSVPMAIIAGKYTNNTPYYAKFEIRYPTYSKSTGMRLGDAIGDIGEFQPNESNYFVAYYMYFLNSIKDVVFDFDNPIIIATNIR